MSVSLPQASISIRANQIARDNDRVNIEVVAVIRLRSQTPPDRNNRCDSLEQANRADGYRRVSVCS
jgi:hypothetical protein